MKKYWRSGDIDPCILHTRWRWVISFTPRPFYTQGKSPWYPLHSRLGGPQSRSGHGGKEKNSQLLPGFEPLDRRREMHTKLSENLKRSYHLGDLGVDWNRDSSVGIALGYGLADRGSRVRFPAGTGYFSPHHRVQNGSGAHPASYSTATRGSFPGGKAAGAWSWSLTSIWCRGQ
jgi:hypothetical protein